MSDETPQSLGGKARARSLSPMERKLISSKAAQARWVSNSIEIASETGVQLPLATHQGKMALGGLELDCYVLEDGRRVFHKRGMARALGMKSGGGNVFLRAMQRKGLSSEFGAGLFAKITNPINFKPMTSEIGHGYEADVLVEICRMVVKAHDAGKLTSTQDSLVEHARAILHALEKVGVIALIDEATGYQTVRSPSALRILVQQYIEEEKRQWAKEFPDGYYDELNRLYGSQKFTKTKNGAVIQNRPQHFAHFTRQYVYNPLENGKVLEELDRINPKLGANKKRRARFHQHLTEDYGIAKLKRQVQETMTLMAVSETVQEFKKLFFRRFPQAQSQLELFDD